MRWIGPVAILVAVLLTLATLGVQPSFAVGALAIFSLGALCGLIVSRSHKWVAAAGACVAATVGLTAIGTQDRGDDWWELVAFVFGALTVAAAALWCAGVWLGAKMRPRSQIGP
jgi:apolipoprotein N-acyltransferase